MLCELCGNDVPRTKTVVVEATVLAVCPSCARFGTEVGAPAVRRKATPPVIAERLEARRRRMTPRDVYTQGGEEDLAEDYAARIRAAREARGWKQAELAAKINERVTVIAKIESGAMMPNEDLLRRLERALEIKLKEKVPTVQAKKGGAREGMTLGDLMDLEGEG
ncbi:MAG: TIGR00270 family protein [Methanobacteriota archaeon]|nr:MAG: TIGR00270 family protein [Euryarchaeota archaeon]